MHTIYTWHNPTVQRVGPLLCPPAGVAYRAFSVRVPMRGYGPLAKWVAPMPWHCPQWV
jgi:hypothetical protein